MFLVEVLLTPLLAALFSAAIGPHALWLGLLLFLGTIGFSSVGGNDVSATVEYSIGSLSEGPHFATLLGYALTGGTANWPNTLLNLQCVTTR